MNLDSSEPDLRPFGQELPDEEWLGRIRRAARAPGLGRVGDFLLLEEINRGAQGVVYRARREGETGDVAVKRLLAGAFATGVAQARFERELETAAALKHPNIVGALTIDSSERHPLLVMEWINGVAVDRWADLARKRGCKVREVLEVFLEVCDAVHYAHQRGVIHRDLKPSNILVDASDRPHLLDFGLAKIMDVEAAQGMTMTGTSDFLGTPAYAAPEQVRGEHTAVDVRTDIYALGVILFRMLTGRLPFDSARGLADLLADIQHADAARPSRLNEALNDELDAIIGKAMAKEADRRYASVDAFAADVRRYLAGEPVEAQRGRRWYELRKTIHRHRTLVVAGATLFAVVTGAVVVLAAMYARQGQLLAQVSKARDAETRAHDSARRQQRVLEELLAAAAGIGKGADLEVRRAWLDEATRLVEADLLDEPAAQSAAHDAIGRTYQSLALYPEAEVHLRKALDLRHRAHLQDDPDVAASLDHLGALLQDRNHFADAEPFLRQALAMRKRFFSGDHAELAESLNSVGLIEQFHHDYVAALDCHNQALAIQRRLFGSDHAAVAHTLELIGTTYLNQSQYAAAAAVLREALEIDLALFGEDHRAVAGARVNLAKALFNLGQYAGAEPLFRQAVATNRRLLGDTHDNVAWGLHRLGILLHAEGDYAEAEATLLESLAIYRRCFGDDDHYVALVLNSLGTLLLDRDELATAKPLFEEALAIQDRLHPSDDPSAVGRKNRLAEWLEQSGDTVAAEPLLREVLGVQDFSESTEYPYVVRCMYSLSRILLDRGEDTEAEALLVEALDLRRARFGDQHPEVGLSLVTLGAFHHSTERFEEARALIEQGIGLLRRTLSDDHPELARSLLLLARTHDALGEPERAAERRIEADAICRRRPCPLFNEAAPESSAR